MRRSVASRLLQQLATALVRQSAGRQTPPTSPGGPRCLPTASSLEIVCRVSVRRRTPACLPAIPPGAIRGKELHTCGSATASQRFGAEAEQQEKHAPHDDVDTDQRK